VGGVGVGGQQPTYAKNTYSGRSLGIRGGGEYLFLARCSRVGVSGNNMKRGKRKCRSRLWVNWLGGGKRVGQKFWGQNQTRNISPMAGNRGKEKKPKGKVSKNFMGRCRERLESRFQTSKTCVIGGPRNQSVRWILVKKKLSRQAPRKKGEGLEPLMS